MRVLLVEDDPMIGASAQTGLRQDGFSVDWVRDGPAALAALAANPFDAVLLDLGLPGKSGDEVLKSIRRAGNDVPVLIINGANDPATPPSAGRAAMSRMSNARMIVVPHGGHMSEGLIGDECVKKLAARFLETADQKSLDVACVKNIRHRPFMLPRVSG